jgi:hypothetical protein
MESKPTQCQFEHPGIAALDQPVFRLSKGDRLPALAIKLDNNDVLLPLAAVAKLFDIAATSPDGHMLHLVGQALRFVPALRLGDALPPEIVTGEASWTPSPHHLRIASARLQLQLVNWISGVDPSGGGELTTQMLVVSIDDPAIRARVQDALRSAAQELGLDGGASAVAALLERLATEIAFVEALRERLHDRAQCVLKRLLRFGLDSQLMPPARRETLNQVTRLATVGVAGIASRFDALDAQTAEIMAALCNLDNQRDVLRPSRDRLYSQLLEWEPMLQAWEALPASMLGEGVWRAIDDAYRFLAPRFMSVQEWQNVLSEGRLGGARTAYVW